MKITELTLHCELPAEQKRFYAQMLGFPEIEGLGGSDGFSMHAGYTRVNFVPGNADARYHFAFNIRPDQLNDAAEWIQQSGVDLLYSKNDRSIVVDFPAWKAKSLYFFDPCGNIVELIARAAIRPAGNAPRFSSASVLGISEIGIVTEDVKSFREWIENAHGISGFHRQENTDVFSAMGDDEGLLLIVEHKRPWLMGDFEAIHHPLAISGIHNDRDFRLILP
ncbi:MAG: hypothetical protein Fur0041_04340 [Bacteroidia bacterium]